MRDGHQNGNPRRGSHTLRARSARQAALHSARVGWGARRRGSHTLALWVLLAVVAAGGCGSSSSSAATDSGTDAPGGGDAGISVCPASDAGAPAGASDDFGPNAKAGASSSALGQLDIYEITSARALEWVDLYLRADLAGTRLTIAIYEAAARNAVFRKLTAVQVDVPPCVGWIGSGPLAIPLVAGRFYAIGFDPNQAVTAFLDSETNDLPVDGQFGRLIGSKTSTSVSIDTLDWGTPSDKSFTRQRLFTLPQAGGDGGSGDDADAGATGDAPNDRPGALDAAVGDGAVLDARG